MNNNTLYHLLGNRIETFLNFFTGEGRVDGSTMTRTGLIEKAWNVFLENPIMGVGVGAFENLNQWNYYAHNNYLELMTGVGILGFIAFYWIYVYIIYKLLKLLKESDDKVIHLLLALLLTNLLYDFATVSYYRSYFLMYICLGICYIGAAKNKKNLVKQIVK